MKKTSANKNKAFNFSRTIVCATGILMFVGHGAAAAQSPVDLGTAGNYAILAKSGISTIPTSAITGDIGVSPIDSTALTGFSLALDGTGQFATSLQITGRAYASDYAVPTPVNLTTAVGDMQTAYTDAAGRTTPDFTELGAGEIGGRTLVHGLYKWGTDVLISSDVTISGGPNDVWIFQIAGKITQANGTRVFLSGGALAKNIFWQAFGDVSVGTTAHFEGIILSQSAITFATGATINGRLLSQTAVTLDSITVTSPVAAAGATTLISAVEVTGPYVDVIGQSVNLSTKTITAPQMGGREFYRIRATTALTITNITVSGGNVIIKYN